MVCVRAQYTEKYGFQEIYYTGKETGKILVAMSISHVFHWFKVSDNQDMYFDKNDTSILQTCTGCVLLITVNGAIFFMYIYLKSSFITEKKILTKNKVSRAKKS